MLSYMLPVDDKSPPHNLNLTLNLQNNGVNAIDTTRNVNESMATNSKTQTVHFERSSALRSAAAQVNGGGGARRTGNSDGTTSEIQRPKSLVKPNQSIDMDAGASDSAGGSSSGSILLTAGNVNDDSKKGKMTKIGGNTKNTALKRFVSIFTTLYTLVTLYRTSLMCGSV